MALTLLQIDSIPNVAEQVAYRPNTSAKAFLLRYSIQKSLEIILKKGLNTRYLDKYQNITNTCLLL